MSISSTGLLCFLQLPGVCTALERGNAYLAMKRLAINRWGRTKIMKQVVVEFMLKGIYQCNYQLERPQVTFILLQKEKERDTRTG